MSEESGPPRFERPVKTRLIFKVALVLVLVFIALLFLPAFFMAGRMGLMGAVSFGWWRFLGRTLPGISWNWDIVGMSVLCGLLVLLLAHVFLRWITTNIASARGRNWLWPWKWTWCGLIAVLVLFLVGMAVGGAAHQIGWIMSSNEPWYEEKRGNGHDVSNMRQLDLGFRQALKDEHGNIENVRRELWIPDGDYLSEMKSAPPMMQAYHLLVIIGEDGKVAGTIIFPRNGQRQAAIGGYYSLSDKGGELILMPKLQELLHKHRANLIAL